MTDQQYETSSGKMPSCELEQATYRSYRNNSAELRAPERMLGKSTPARDPGAFLAHLDMAQFTDERLDAMEMATLKMLTPR